MAAFIALFFVSLVAATGLASAINYFFRLGPWRSLGFAFLAVSVFLAFCMTGLWEDASRHDWGYLTPVFALMLIGSWVGIKFGKKIWDFWKGRKRKRI